MTEAIPVRWTQSQLVILDRRQDDSETVDDQSDVPCRVERRSSQPLRHGRWLLSALPRQASFPRDMVR